jgi:choline dehydrogenase-like flavoprotein
MMSERFDVVVVGSGAGGGVIAGQLAERGREVLLLEAGPHLTAADFSRWEARANHDLWWPLTEAQPVADGGEVVTLFRGRCVGGGTTINTKVGLRAHESDYAKWHAASGLLGEDGEPFSEAHLAPHYERVEAALGVRERTDWLPFVNGTAKGFEALGASLSPVRSYTDTNCMRCGSCLQGCPTNAGKSTLNTYIHHAWALGKLELRAQCDVRRVLMEDRGAGPEATGVEYVDAAGATHEVRAGAVVVACGTLATPGLLMRSGVVDAAGGSPSARQIGRNLGFHPSRLVFGLFDEIQDAHRAYPITAHCMDFQSDTDGGFVIESATVMDPIAFASSIRGEDGRPLWGGELVEALDAYRHWTGLLAMVNDENNGTVTLGQEGEDRFSTDFNASERLRIEDALAFSADVLRAAGAKRVLRTDLFTSHVQGSCRMGSDPTRSAVDANCESHDVRRLFVGDGSLVPRTLSVNPSLTFMALADRLAGYLASGEHGYFATR